MSVVGENDPGTPVSGEVESSPFLVVTGMHRSNTSLLAQLLQGSGINMGDRLVGARSSNPYGHFEDEALVAFQEEILRENGLGWRVMNVPRIVIADRQRARARQLVLERHRKGGGLWGFKAPQAVLLLDMWREFPGARFFFIFREPRSVLRSLFVRVGLQVYYKPYYLIQAVRTYVVYNRLIIRCRESEPDRSVIVESADLLRQPRGVIEKAMSVLKLDPVGTVDESLVDHTIVGGAAPVVPDLLAKSLARLPAVRAAFQTLRERKVHAD